MKKMIGIAIALVSINSYALNQSDLAAMMARQTELSKTKTTKFTNDWEDLVKAKLDSGMRVRTGAGTYAQGIAGQKKGKNPKTGEAITYTIYHQPKGVKAVTEKQMVKEMAEKYGYTQDETRMMLDSYYTSIVTAVAKGDTVTSRGGLGGYGSGKRAAHTRRLPNGTVINIAATTVVRHTSTSAMPGLKFTPSAGFNQAVSRRR